MDPGLAVLLVLVTLVAAIGIVVLLVVRHTRQKQRASWEALAATLGGSVERNRHDDRLMRATLAGRQVTIHYYFISGRYSSQWHAEIDATCDDVGPFRLVVLPRQIAVTRADPLTGDPDFDHEHLIRTNDPAFALAWLSQPVRAALRGAPEYSYTLEGALLHAEFYPSAGSGLQTVVDPQPDLHRMVYAAQAAVELANGGQHLRARWAELAQALGGKLSHGAEEIRIELLEQSPPLAITTELAGDIHVIAVRARLEGARAEAFEICHAEYRSRPDLTLLDLPAGLLPAGMVVASIDPARTAPRLDESVGPELAQLMPVWVRSDGNEITVTQAGAEPDRHRVERAMALARHLATPRGGAYRS